MQAADDTPTEFYWQSLWHTSFQNLTFTINPHTQIYMCKRILPARLSALLCLGTGSPWVAEALAADHVHLAATPSYSAQKHTLPAHTAPAVTSALLTLPLTSRRSQLRSNDYRRRHQTEQNQQHRRALALSWQVATRRQNIISIWKIWLQM